MHLRYDEDFVEAAVRLCAAGRCQGVASLQVVRFNREREKLYDLLDADDRNAAFFKLHLSWFREWGLEELLTKPLREFPRLAETLTILAFRRSRSKDDDGSELYVNETGERNGVVAMRPERLQQNSELLSFLRHELTHLHDMLDPVFGYQPELPILGPTQSSHRLARERYRLLWDVSIDGRLSQNRHPTIATKDHRWLELTTAFPFWPEVRQKQIFLSLWENPVPTHRELAELVCDPRELQSGNAPGPGASCPLCGFPTFVWADPTSLADHTVRVIHSEFPHWAPEQGACARCASIYRVNRPEVSGVL